MAESNCQQTLRASPRFITLEGIEGAGKTTALRHLCDYLKELSIDYVLTREPGGTVIAEEIRHLLLQASNESMCPDTELLLMFAGRAQNIAQVIRPALNQGKWVVSDRFTDASFAYQGGGRQIAFRHIEELAQWVQGDLKPDLTFLLDLPVETGISRIQGRGAKDRIEREGLVFFERVREAYLMLAAKEPERIQCIDATQSPETVGTLMREALSRRWRR